MIKLCYKEYDWKLSNEACKSFFDKTGLDLQTVFGSYIDACQETVDRSLISRMQILSKLYPRDVACKALHSIIKPVSDGVSLSEIEDGTYRVSWMISDRPDDLSEPWPFVMLNTALKINEYFNANIPKKKADISE
jgi:hypothetical protein